MRAALISSTILIALAGGASGWGHGLAGPAHAETPATVPTPNPVAPAPHLTTRSEARTGTLLFPTSQPGKYIAAPTLGMDVQIDISGPIARTTLVQRFTNPSDQWVEGVYVFPLPDTAAVDSLRLKVGDRLIDGTIQERKKAKQIYEAAKAAGQTAALTEQERPNIFTNSVANIGPGETVSVRLTYQETVQMEENGFGLRFPMVVGPRYIPRADSVQVVSLDGGGGFSSSVTDAARITPPVLHPDEGPINPVTLRVDLAPGFDVGPLTSPSHQLSFIEDPDGSFDITLDGDVFADRDFVLEWKPETGATPTAGLFSERVGEADYHLLMVTPTGGAPLDLPRDVTFILDISGSMQGESIRQAKAGLQRALDGLGPEDRFNIIAFNDALHPMWTGLRSATLAELKAARRWLSRQDAGGGTDMLPALDEALRQQHPDADRLGQILFLTDGAIGNEDQLFETIARRRGNARVFTIGMGSAPNTHFMRRAAELGQGTHTHIGDVSEAAARMDALAEKLAHPVLTDIRLSWPDGTAVEAWPDPVPDLYDGEPLVVAARTEGGTRGHVRVTGMRGDTPWEAQLPLGPSEARPGVSKIWARDKIASLELDIARDHALRDSREAAILSTALEHSLVSRLTSLVAVDVTPRRPDGQPLLGVDMPTNLPKGWDFDAVFGDAPSYPVESFGQLAPSTPPQAAPERHPIDIPRGSTPMMWNALIGMLLLILAFIFRGRSARLARDLP